MNFFMHSYGFEFHFRKMFCVFRVGVVQVDGPGGGRRSIGINHVIRNVLFFQNQVAQQPARFPFPGNVGHPFQPVVGVFLFGNFIF